VTPKKPKKPKKASKKKVSAKNKEMAARYKRAYTKQFKDLPLYKQKKIKEDPDSKETKAFIKNVMKLAEEEDAKHKVDAWIAKARKKSRE
jgi:hypothetical protein